MRKLLVLFLMTSLLLPSYASMRRKNKVVSSSKEITKAIKTLKSGDTLIIADGVYSDINIDITKSGTPEDNIVVKCQNRGKVTISGDSYLKINGSYITVDGLLFTMVDRQTDNELIAINGDNNTLTHCKALNIRDSESFTTIIRGKQCKINNCSFVNKGASGACIYIKLSDNNSHAEISNCYFSRPKLPSNGNSSIRIGVGYECKFDSYAYVHHNLFENADGESEIVCVKSNKAYIAHNTFRNCFGHLSLRQSNGSIVEGNFFIGDKTKKNVGGIYIRGMNHYVFNNMFYNLTPYKDAAICIGAASDFDKKRDDEGKPGRHFPLTKNNIIAYNTIIGTTQLDSVPKHAISYASDYEPNGKRHILPDSITLANNAIKGGIYIAEQRAYLFDSNIYNGPKFYNPETEEFFTIEGIDVKPLKYRAKVNNLAYPQNNSAIINLATSDLPLPTNYNTFTSMDTNINNDIYGRKRDINDVGAIEITNADITEKPLVKSDVGCKF